MTVRRLGLIAALAVQVWVLYLYVPGGTDALAVPHLDKVVHAAIFALPAALGVAAGLRWWLVGAVLAVHAPISEFVQYYWLPGRNGDPWDVVADVGGVALGLAIGCLLPTPGRGRGLLGDC